MTGNFTFRVEINGRYACTDNPMKLWNAVFDHVTKGGKPEDIKVSVVATEPKPQMEWRPL